MGNEMVNKEHSKLQGEKELHGDVFNSHYESNLLLTLAFHSLKEAELLACNPSLTSWYHQKYTMLEDDQ